MNLTTWCKSILSVYHMIPVLTSSIDKIILTKSVNSAMMSEVNYGVSSLGQIENLINLSQKKINLINLKVITDNTLLDIDAKKSKLLTLKFIDGLSNEDVAQVLKISIRTFYRHLTDALNSFEIQFVKNVLSNKKVYKSFKDDCLIDDLFEKINELCSKSKNADTIINNYSGTICSFIINKIKQAI